MSCSSGFTEITDPAKIKEILHSFFKKPEGKKSPSYIPAIYQKPGEDWNGWEVTPGGHVIECARPMSAATFHDTGEVVYTLTNMDSNYQSPIGTIRLSGITKIHV